MKNTKTFQVVMLPTKGTKEAMLSSNLVLGDIKLFFADNPSYYAWGHQHLYLISNEKIAQGDWFFADERNHISDNLGKPMWTLLKCDKIENGWIYSNSRKGEGFNPDWSKKIIASTDKSITPNSWIPESFIKAYIKSYNENKSITEVDLEIFSRTAKVSTGEEALGTQFQKGAPITRPERSVVIHQSKMYSREDVKDLIYKYGTKIMSEKINVTETNKWIEENL